MDIINLIKYTVPVREIIVNHNNIFGPSFIYKWSESLRYIFYQEENMWGIDRAHLVPNFNNEPSTMWCHEDMGRISLPKLNNLVIMMENDMHDAYLQLILAYAKPDND